jgi:hypothetical protein
MLRSLRALLKGPKKSAHSMRFFKNMPMTFDALEDRSVPAAFTAGNLAVLQADASANNTTFSILELAPSTAGQTPANTIPISPTGPSAMRISGSATSTGYLSHTNDGTLLTFNAANTETATGNINTLNPRGVGTLNATGAFAVPTTYTGVSGNQTRSSTSLDNSTWFIADQGGIYTNGATAPDPAGNFRSIKSFGGTVYVFTASASLAPVSTVSAPTGGTITGLPGLANGVTSQTDFYMIQSGDNGTTYDVLYILAATSNTAGTVSKYSLVSGSWTANGSYTTTFGGFGMAAADQGNGAALYVSTGAGALAANSVLKLADTAGFNATIAIDTPSNVTLYTAPAGTIVKGVDFVPIPGAPTQSTTTTVTAAPPSPVLAGTSVTFTATVTGSPSAGTVTFYAGPGLSNPIGSPVSIVGGSATSSATTTLPAGSNTITAVYSGGSGFGGSQGTTTYVVNQAPAFTSNASATFTVGAAGGFTVTASGHPAPTISLTSGTLPTGVTFVTGALSGTPTQSGTFPLVFTASNGIGANATQNFTLTVEAAVPSSVYTPGNLTILQAGTGVDSVGGATPVFQTTGQLYLNEITTSGVPVQQTIIPVNLPVGGTGNQPITIDLSASPGNGQLTRSYDGSSLVFGGLASGLNSPVQNGKAASYQSGNRVMAVAGNNPADPNFLNTKIYGPFYDGDDNRGGVAVTRDGPVYSVGHPNQSGGAVTNGVHYFGTFDPSIGTQVSASLNIRGGTIGFDKRFYGSTAGMISAAGNVSGIFTEVNPLPTDADANPATDIMVVPALFTASKLGGIYLADMNGDGITDNGDRLYFVDDGTVGGAGTGGLYVATWNDAITANAWNSNTLPYINHWSLPVRLGDAPAQDVNVGNLRGVTGTVIGPTQADIYTNAFDNKSGHVSYVQKWVDTGLGVAVADARIVSGTTVEITTLTPHNYVTGDTVVVDGVGTATSGAPALLQGYNGSWVITVIDATHFQYNDTNANAAALTPVSNKGAANRAVTPTTILALPTGNNTFYNGTVPGSSYASIGLRGIAFAPVAPTGVTLSQSPANPLTPGANVTLTATLTNAQVASLSGQVAFIDENTDAILGFGPIVGNQASLTIAGGLVGNHYVSAYYGGGGPQALASAASNIIQVIQAGATTSTTVAASSLASVAIGKTVTLTATVTGAGSPSGTVSFYNGSVALANLIGTAPIAAGQASLTTSFSAAGAQNIIAVYNGNAAFASSQGTTTVNVAVNATATVTSSANNVPLGSVQTYTATLTGNATLGVPSGTVVFNLVSAVNNGAEGAPSLTATSPVLTLIPGANNTATATWTGPALTVAGSYLVTVSYNAAGATNPYSGFATNTTSSTNGVAFIQTVKQAFTPGNLIAVQRGDGTSNLGSNGYLTFLAEYTQAGALVQKIALPNVDSGSSHALLLSGQDPDEGLLAKSANGNFLTLIGYDVPVGKTFVTSTFPHQFGRTIARIDGAGNIDTSTVISTTAPASSPFVPLSAVSNDGKQFWIISDLNGGNTTESGIQYVASLGATTATNIGPLGQSGRYAGISGGNLYISTGGTVTQLGSGLPTTASTLNALPGLTAAYDNGFAKRTPKQFLFLNTADGTSNNPNLLYVADQTNGLIKFYKDAGGNWVLPSSFGQKLVFAGGATGVVGYVVNPGTPTASVKLVVTGSNLQGVNANQIASFTDLNGGALGSGANSVDNGFTPGNFATTAFVGVFGNPSGPNGNMNFAGLSFAPGYVTSTTLKDEGAGANYSFTATVSSLGTTVPTGVVIFSIDGTVIGQSNVNASGVATFTTTTFPTTGSHVVTAAYQGDLLNGTSTGTLTQAASPIAPTDLIVTRVGAGTALSANGTAVFIDQYNSSTAAQTAPVQSIALPTTGASAFTVHGTTTTEGYVAASADGHTAALAGYAAAAGGSVNGANGVIGVINPNGSIETSTQIPAANIGGNSNSVRAVASVDGLGFYIVSANNHIQYVPYGNSGLTSTTKISNYFPSPNGVTISPAGQLLVNGGAGVQTNGVPAIDGPASIGVGLPTSGGQTGSVFLGFPITNTPNGFPTPAQFAVSPDGNTIFVADSRTNVGGGLLQFFQAIPGQWTNVNPGGAGFPIGATGADSGLRGLSVDFSDPINPIIYGTTSAASGNRLVKITGGTTDGSTPTYDVTTLATAATNQAFRGVSLAPKAAGATASTTTLSVSDTPAEYGTGVTLIANVSPPGATGWVSFRRNGVEIGAARLGAGPSLQNIATLRTAGNLGAGSFNDIVAVYTGDATFAPSTSAAQSATVTKAATSTALAAAFTSIATGTPDMLTATLTVPAGTAPTGTVTFWDGPVGTGTNLGTAPVSQVIVNQGGPKITFIASVNATFSTVGVHELTAVYSGDDNFTTSSGTQSVTVVQFSSTVVTTNNANPAGSGASVTLTATVTGTTPAPTGMIQFYDNLLPIGAPVNLTPGAGSSTASITVSTALLQAANSLTPGLHSISAVYAGDADYFTSTGVYQQAVKPQAFGADNKFVYRVGDGTTSLIAQPPNPLANNGPIGSTIFIDEYTPAGTLVQSLILPSADGMGSQSAIHAIVGNGQQSSTGQLSLSGDGRYLFLTGYDNNPLNVATAKGLPNQNDVNVPRAVARIRFDGTIETMAFTAGAAASGGVQTGGNFNGVYSPDGNQFYVSGFNGVSYFSSFTPSTALVAATANITSTTFTVTGLSNSGSNLVAVGGPTSGASNLVQQYTGLPTATATPAALPGVNNTTDPAQTFTVDAYFTHLEGTGAPAGINTFYLSDNGPGFANGKITKWSLVGGTWMLTDTLAANTGNSALTFYFLSGVTDASGNVSLYTTYGNGGNANTGPGHLYAISDTNGYNAPLGTGGTHSDAVTIVASVPTGSFTTFRGVAGAPKASIIATTTTLVATPNASTGGQLVTFTATVAPSPGAAGTVTFKDNGVALPGGANVAVVGGVASFQISSLSIGTHPISADYSGDVAAGFAASTSNTLSFVVSPAGTPPTVTSFTINGSTPGFGGNQRSRVVDLTIVFDQAVQLDADAVTLALHPNVDFGGPQPGGVGALPAITVTPSSDNKTFTVTFSGANTVVDPGADGFQSLKDGVYDYTIVASKVHPLGTPGVSMAANSTGTFHRLFGDINPPTQTGNSFTAVVNTGDNLQFRNAFNKPVGGGYLPYFDVNGDGTINSGDNLQFRNRFNKALTWTV